MKTRNFTIVLLVLLLTTIVGYYWYQVYQIKNLTDNLVANLQEGKLNLAKDLMLTKKEQADSTENTLIFLSQAGEGALSSPRSASLKGLATGSVKVNLAYKGDRYPLILEVKKINSEWKISSLGQIEVYPAALVEKIVPTGSKRVVKFLSNGILKDSTYSGKDELKTKSAYYLVSYKGDLIYKKPLEKKLLSKLLSLQDGFLEGEKEGLIKLWRQANYYDLSGQKPELKSLEELIVGRENLTLYYRGDLASLITSSDKYSPRNIRVAINRNGFAGLEHKELVFSSAGGLRVQDKILGKTYFFNGKENLQVTTDGEVLILKTSSGATLTFKERIHIDPVRGTGIKFSNISRGEPGEKFNPIYPGKIEVASNKDHLIVVNEVPVEKYLYSVVASEMPLSFGLEALKVQAIAARSFAFKHIYQGNFQALGAHVDDSVQSQVFNNTKENLVTNQAVETTRGLVLHYEGRPIDAKFFSTSSGFTANYHEVWSEPNTNIFPGKKVPYLISKSQLPGKEELQLVEEEQFRTFITSPNNLAFDRPSPFFRWSIVMTGEQLAASIEQNLAARYKLDPNFILTRTEKGWQSIDIPEKPLGKLRDLSVISRGEGNNVIELRIDGEKASYLIKKELNIRQILKPQNYLANNEDVLLERWDGSILRNYPLLPSSFFVMDIFAGMVPREVTKVFFYGGGNGHGVGMSQWGVKGMIEQRYSLEEILNHYYPGAKLSNLYL